MSAPDLHLEADPGSLTHPLWQDRLSLLLASTGEAMFGVNLAGRCIFINRAGAQMLGYEPREVIGRNMHELIHHSRADGSQYPEAECPIFNAFREGRSCRIDSEVLWRRDGSAFAAEYTSHPVVENGVVLGAVATVVDIGPRRAAALALQRAKDELEQRVSERTRELSAALERLRELSAYSDTVREQERTRIAREVHDELGSLLVALKMGLGWIDRRLGELPAAPAAENNAANPTDLPQRLRCKCRDLSALVDTAVDSVGRIITDLRPSILDHQGLWAALEWQAQEFAAASEIDCRLRFATEGAPPPPEPVAIALFRIFQEMLSNVARHARCTRLSIEVQADGEGLRIEVADNGVGAEPHALDSPGAYGVLGMRERSRQIGAQLQIDSRPGAGTTVRLLRRHTLH